ncbi:ATP-binding protein [Chitinophaga costaii]|nr:ATP-binding protein [Chitinophaga costaii]
MALIPVTTEWLHSLESLKDVPENQLQWFIDHSAHLELHAGDFLVKPGEVIRGTQVMVSGKVLMYSVQEGIRRELFTVTRGDITGYLPYSRAHYAGLYAEAIEDVQCMMLPRELGREMIQLHFELTQALVHIMTNRVRDFSLAQQQNEKMLALGKLSAGLAHELNNPAAAIVRDAVTLKQHLQLIPERFKDVIGIRMEDSMVEALSQLFYPMVLQRKHQNLSLAQRMQEEDKLTEWLNNHQVANSDDIAETLVEFGICETDLEKLNKLIPARFATNVFNWLHSNLVTEKIVEDIEESSNRIASLVNSVKIFTHMDRDQGKDFTDIHPGIRNTLVLLGFKIRKGKVNVIENFGADVPHANVMAGELNQVWTNLIDNALDAMEVNGKGTLTITTRRRDPDKIEITIADDGPGIPPNIQNSIFEPFFTTKEMGKGTGMGLEVVQKIVRQHHGSIQLNTSPAGTAFIVCLPVT